MSKLDKIKNVFRPGHDKDDNTMYDTSNTSEAPSQPTATASATTSSTATAGDNQSKLQTEQPKSDFLPPIATSPTDLSSSFSSPPSDDPVSAAVKESEASKSDHTGITRGLTLADRAAERDRREAEEDELPPIRTQYDNISSTTDDQSHLARDGAIGGVGAAGVVGAGTATYETEKSRDTDVDNATYTDRKFVVGGNEGSSTLEAPARPPIMSIPSMPHVPGEFPLETGEDPHESADANLARSKGLGTADPATTAAAAAMTGSHQKSAPSAVPATEAQPADRHYGRDGAIAGVGGGAAAAAAYAAYEKTRDPNVNTADPTSMKTTATTTAAQAPPTPAPSQTTAATAEPTTVPPPTEHHYGRDAAIVGGTGVASAAAYGAYEESKKGDPQPLAQDQGEAMYTSQAAHSAKPAQASPPKTSETTKPITAAAATSAPEQTQPTTETHYGRDAALVGGTGAAGAAAYAGYEESKDKAEPQSLAQGADQAMYASQAAHTAQPAQAAPAPTPTKAENIKPVTATALPPSGELQTETSKHDYARDAAIAGGAGGLAGAGAYGLYEANKTSGNDATASGDQGVLPSQAAHTSQPVTAPETSDEAANEHHYGRDAAVAGGVAGATGLGATGVYEATKSSKPPAPAPAPVPAPVPAPHTQTPPQQAQPKPEPSSKESTPKKIANKLTKSKPASKEAKSEPVQDERADEDEHHYGRDAAVVGGATAATGAAGYGAYEAAEGGRGDTGPASKTIGPHESNLANVVDPRVQPDPSKMKDRVTSGPHKSDIANILDPRVRSDPEPEGGLPQSEPHDGRDPAAVTGVGGAVAYEETEPGPAPTQGGTTTAETQHHNKVITDSHGHSKLHKKSVEVPGGRSSMGGKVSGEDYRDIYDEEYNERLRESREADGSTGETSGEKKHGLLSKILHPNRTRREKEEQQQQQQQEEDEAAAAT